MCDPLCKIVNLVAALGSVCLGVQALGYDVFSMMGSSQLAHIAMYVFGAAGVASIVMMIICSYKCRHGHHG
jgi:uncharacterized membrane protein YuzA (DUF378 family)